MKITDMRVGQKVRCVWIGKTAIDRRGRICTITDIIGDYINVEWDDGYQKYKSWKGANCFEPLQDQPLQPTPVQSHICKCGIFRGDCIYHKD